MENSFLNIVSSVEGVYGYQSFITLENKSNGDTQWAAYTKIHTT